MVKAIKMLSLSLLILTITACSDEPTPSDITQGFWQAVVNNNQEQIKQYIATGTLDDPSILDNSEKSITGIEIGEATEQEGLTFVKTTLIGKNDSAGEQTRLAVDTVLVMENESWKVDGQKTVNNLMATSVNAMIQNVTKNFDQIGAQLSKSLSAGVQQFMGEMNKSLPEVQKGLDQLQDEDTMKNLGQQLGQLFSQGLQQVVSDLNTGLGDLSKELEAEKNRLNQQQAAPNNTQ